MLISAFEPVQFNMTFPKADIVSGEPMVSVFIRQFLLSGEFVYNILQDGEVQPALFGELKVFSETI